MKIHISRGLSEQIQKNIESGDLFVEGNWEDDIFHRLGNRRNRELVFPYVRAGAAFEIIGKQKRNL